MKKMRLILGSLLSLGLLACSTPVGNSTTPTGRTATAKVDDKVRQLAGSVNAFGFSLLRTLHETQSKENIFISPSSVSSACTMAYLGAAGACKQEMGTVLQIPGAKVADASDKSDARLTSNYEELNSSLASIGKDAKFTSTNAIFVDDKYKFRPAFVDLCSKAFSAECKSLPFNSQAGIDSVNAWAKEKTNGKIPELILEAPPDLAGILANVVYFKGNWKLQFKKDQTIPRDFHNADGSTNEVQMMALGGELLGFAGTGFKAVSLPYEGNRLKAYIFLPDKGLSLEALLQQLTLENWSKWVSSFSKKPKAFIELPRFTLDYGNSLLKPLKKLGMTKPFEYDTSDFKPMFETNEKIRIADVVHKTFVQVNEEGTEAAAATAVVMEAETAAFEPDDRFGIVVDRPFIFAIADDLTGSVLFLGTIQKLKPEMSK